VHVHADIFSASHKGVPFWKVEFSTQNLLQKGHPFILRRVTGHVKWQFTFPITALYVQVALSVGLPDM